MAKIDDKLKGIREKSKKKFIALMTAIFFSVAALGFGLITLYGYIMAKINIAYAQSFDAIGSSYEAIEDEDGYYTFTLKSEDDNFTIMQITDLHIGGGYASAMRDRETIKAIHKLADHTRPDFIVVTGDMSYAILGYPGTNDNKRAMDMTIAILEAIEIPYMVCFGNHDTESFNYLKREDIANMFASDELKYSLFKRQTGGDKDVFGEGNCVIKLKNSNGTINNGFIFLDSNDYKSDGVHINGGYDVIHDDQINWYKEEVQKLNAPTLAFFHIPLPEFQEAWSLYEKGSSEVEYIQGYYGDESVCSASPNTGLFDLMVELGSTKGVFCGHDHTNTFALKYKGIVLSYSMSLDRIAYPTIILSNWQRGANIITINADGTFDLDQVVYAALK